MDRLKLESVDHTEIADADDGFKMKIEKSREVLRPKREVKSKQFLILEELGANNFKKKPKRFPCSICKSHKSFATQKQRERHILKVHSKKKASIACELCSVVLKSEQYFKRHMATRHPESPKQYTCDYDGKTFSMKDYLRVHMDRHRRHQLLFCEICQKGYISRHTFRRHLKMHIEKHVCSVCGVVFSSKVNLENHHASQHSEELPFQCKFCTRLFSNKTARNNHHYMSHKNSTNELNFKCHECNIFFEMKEELRIHSFIHFNGDIKTCLECDQIFKTNRLLNIHMQKHENKKSFQCQGCSEYFTFKTGLSKHIRLNRCKGPTLVIEPTPGLKRNEALIAKDQLKKITKTTKSARKETNVVTGLKGPKRRRQPGSEDDFKNFMVAPEVEKKSETPKSQEDLKKTRAFRKRKSIVRTKPRSSRGHHEYTCDICGETVKFMKEFLKHMKEQHLILEKYQCKLCDSKFKSLKNLSDHLAQSHEMKVSVLIEKFSCDVCDRKFDLKSRLESHKLSHDESSRNLICSVCSAAFKTIGNLRRHEATHATTLDFRCCHCQKMFKTKVSLSAHLLTVHAEIKVFVKCHICEVILLERYLKNHIKNQHTEKGQEKLFGCGVCQKSFKTQKLAENHFEATHEPKDKGLIYSCQQCPEQFFRQRLLREHTLLVHFNGMVYQCDTCCKLFKSQQLLNVHSVVHSENEVNFPCTVCDVVLKTKGGHLKHMKTHQQDLNSEQKTLRALLL